MKTSNKDKVLEVYMKHTVDIFGGHIPLPSTVVRILILRIYLYTKLEN